MVKKLGVTNDGKGLDYFTTRFSAHVDIVSSTFNKYNLSSVEDYLSNQYTSKLNLSTSAKGVFFVDMTASYTQSTTSTCLTRPTTGAF